MKHLVIVFLTLVLMTGLYAGIKEHQPQHEETGVVTLPPVTPQTPMVEANLKTNPLVPFAHPLPVTLDICNSGEWTELTEGSREWTMKIVSPGATSLQLQFNRLVLPKDTALSIYDKEGTLVEILTAENQKSMDATLSGLYPGDQIKLTYLEPKNTEGQPELEIDKVMQGYRDIFTMPRGYEAAGLVIADGVRAGYGLLVNNNAKNFKPYLLIPFAAIDTAGLDSAENWRFCFKSQVPTAENNEKWLTYRGCTVKSVSPEKGLALVEMKEAPFSKNAKVIYHGWATDNSTKAHTNNLNTPGLLRVNSQNMIMGNIFGKNAWHLPQNGNIVGIHAEKEQAPIGTYFEPLEPEDPYPTPLDSPHISPDENSISCAQKTFEMVMGTCPCYNFYWQKSSNLDYISGQGTRYYTVKAKPGASGSAWVSCQVNDGTVIFPVVTETFTVNIPPADLYPTECSVSPSSGKPGDTITMNCRVRGTSCTSSTLHYYLSKNTTYESSDQYIASDYVGALVSVSSSYESATYTLPSNITDGIWYILFKADAPNNIPETNETNNLCYASFRVYGEVDLIVYMPEVSGHPIFRQPGDTVTISCKIKNTGTKQATTSQLKIYHIPDSPLDPFEEFIGYFHIEALPPGAVSSEISTQYTIPLNAPGHGYIVFVADYYNLVIEENENNNTTLYPFEVNTGY